MKENIGILISNVFLFCFFCLGCNDLKQKHINSGDISQESNYIKFNQNMEDTLSRYISNISDSCNVLIWFDRSYIYKTNRLNVLSVSKKYFTPNNLFFTHLNGHKIFINTALQGLMASYQHENVVNCDGTMFVVYDSMGILTVLENLNAFDDDLRPSQQLIFLKKYRDNK